MNIIRIQLYIIIMINSFVSTFANESVSCSTYMADLWDNFVKALPNYMPLRIYSRIDSKEYEVCRNEAVQGDAWAQFHLGMMYLRGEGVENDKRQGAKWLRKSAEQGHAWGQLILGSLYFSRSFDAIVKEDKGGAERWYRKSAEQGNIYAQYRLGWMYDEGNGVEQDNGEALKWYMKSAELGYSKGQNRLGMMYEKGEGVKQDISEATRWFRLSAEQGYAEAQNKLGEMYSKGKGVELDMLEAARWFRLSAEQGNAEAQNKLGEIYLKGQVVLQDEREALEWFKKAAIQYNAEAQNNLGEMYEQGVVVKQDKSKAAQYFYESATHGNAKAQNNLGRLNYFGEGIHKDKSKAAKWYKRSAWQGNAEAQKNLGRIYYLGEVVEQNIREAVRWYRESAEQGNAKAQFLLGMMYLRGEGVIEDHQKAYFWFLLSATTGNNIVIDARNKVSSLLNQYERRKTKEEASNWLEINRKPKANNNLVQRINENLNKSKKSLAEIAFEKGWRSIVVILADENQGSGVVVKPDVVATNCHIFDQSKSITVLKAYNYRVQMDTHHSAYVSRKDLSRDLCLLNVPGLRGLPAELRLAENLRIGEDVYAIGAPIGLEFSLSAGIVSQLREKVSGSAPYIQTDTAISPGSSGGGLFDRDGNLVGITTLKIIGKKTEGISFAIPADWIQDELEKLY